MSEFFLNNAAWIRLFCFISIFAVMVYWEIRQPRRKLKISKYRRWTHNISLVVVNTFLLRLIIPFAAVELAVMAQNHTWGVLNIWGVSGYFAVLLTIVLLDFVIYLQHIMVHAIPIFWRLHRVHHTDQDFDVTTGSRFHPIEIGLSMLVKFAAILLIGPSALGVLIFEILLNGTSMFNHSNVKLPHHLDRFLRLFIVTPDMHRVHHSWDEHEANSNFGFSLSIWDKIFGTYEAQPAKGHERMQIGVRDFDPEKSVTLDWLLIQPIVSHRVEYSINRRRHK